MYQQSKTVSGQQSRTALSLAAALFLIFQTLEYKITSNRLKKKKGVRSGQKPLQHVLWRSRHPKDYGRDEGFNEGGYYQEESD
jgi:hypothetical protein